MDKETNELYKKVKEDLKSGEFASREYNVKLREDFRRGEQNTLMLFDLIKQMAESYSSIKNDYPGSLFEKMCKNLDKMLELFRKDLENVLPVRPLNELCSDFNEYNVKAQDELGKIFLAKIEFCNNTDESKDKKILNRIKKAYNNYKNHQHSVHIIMLEQSIAFDVYTPFFEKDPIIYKQLEKLLEDLDKTIKKFEEV